MARNRIEDLANILLGQLERLDDDLTDEELAKETKRAQAMCLVSKQVLQVAKTQIEFNKLIKKQEVTEVPALLKGAEIKTKLE